jgi:hypothetical protein
LNSAPVTGSPKEPFPYGKLTQLISGSTMYFYHQLNESMLVEEVLGDLDEPSLQWTEPNYINTMQGS